MSKAALFLINGFEELEAITILDLLRRAQVDLQTISLENNLTVVGKQRLTVTADISFNYLKATEKDMLIIPGGTLAYLEHQSFLQLIAAQAEAGQKIAAICAAPVVLGRLGLLKGRRAVCFPGYEKELIGAEIPSPPPPVVTSGQFTTSRGPATAIHFALTLVSILEDDIISRKVAQDILMPGMPK
ncbi:MAG: DJ-1/PfpI family protein [Deltaproteobacteria bacterium]|nr:DJ-1/PfpI family protein [Deltaproteobacteria bacterium]